MSRKFRYLILIAIVIFIITVTLFRWSYFKNKTKTPILSSPSNQASNNTTTPTKTNVNNLNSLAFPIAEFSTRITKKPFGIYITPENSPVSPERFSGYHTGVDVEYEDVTADVPVYAIADGTVVESRFVSGYGGTFIIEAEYDGIPHTFLYGHIRPSSLPSVGKIVKKGEQLAVLGTGKSYETDGERKHLHFAVTANNQIDLRGYVQNKTDLDLWLNPQDLNYQ